MGAWGTRAMYLTRLANAASWLLAQQSLRRESTRESGGP